jgi:hypothetical protein
MKKDVMSVVRMTVDVMSVGKMIVDVMSVAKMTADKMTFCLLIKKMFTSFLNSELNENTLI